MRHLILLTVLLVAAATAGAGNIGNVAPAKPAGTHPVNPPADRQGGDTLVDAVELTIPASVTTGTTAGYIDDYDEVCPYENSDSADVVYTFEPTADIALSFDMFGSAYDTKIYIYDESLNLVACNDDFYTDYTSKLEAIDLAGGTRYYLVIDGYGGDFGEYRLEVSESVPCVIDCPGWALDEGEPSLTVDYVDAYNGGCNSDEFEPLVQEMYWGQAVCGRSGHYLFGDDYRRDTDWYVLDANGGEQPVYVEVEHASLLMLLGPTDCGSVEVLDAVEVAPCDVAALHVEVEFGTTAWIWFGPADFSPPDGSDVYEYAYWIHFGWYPTATESRSLSGVKSLFR